MSDDAPAPITLRAGPLTLAFDRGELRWIRLGDHEVLRGIYTAVRPPDWSTVPVALENVQVETGADRFSVRFDAAHRAGSVWFAWEGRVDGTPDGRVRFEMDGVARSTFLRNRVGICVLHPVADCAGAACSVETTDGTVRSAVFPRLVSPHQPFLDLRAIRHFVAPGLEAEVRFEGEVFEMEDQRNWSDASFKTYSTPLSIPLPVEVREGERIHQAVTLTLHGEVEKEAHPPKAVARGWLSEEIVRVGVDRADSVPVPRIGFGLGPGELPVEALDRLRALAPAHIRVDLRPSEGGWREKLGTAAEAARACRTGLEVAAFVSAQDASEELATLAEAAHRAGAPLDAWLVFDAGSRTTTPDLVESARQSLFGRTGPGAPVPLLGGGTDAFFAELNRERTAAEGLDLVSLPVSPQVHAFDDATIVENTTSLEWVADTARGFAGDTPLALSPVTLFPRPGTDNRQHTVFGAGWTLGLVAAASCAGFSRLTLFDLLGPAGVMQGGCLLPVGQFLADLAAIAGSAPDARVVQAAPDDRARCLTLAVEANRLLRVYVFNATPRPQDVVVTGLPSEAWRRSFRSEVAGEEAAHGAATAQKVVATRGEHPLRLDGHEIFTLDAEVDGVGGIEG